MFTIDEKELLCSITNNPHSKRVTQVLLLFAVKQCQNVLLDPVQSGIKRWLLLVVQAHIGDAFAHAACPRIGLDIPLCRLWYIHPSVRCVVLAAIICPLL